MSASGCAPRDQQSHATHQPQLCEEGLDAAVQLPEAVHDYFGLLAAPLTCSGGGGTPVVQEEERLVHDPSSMSLQHNPDALLEVSGGRRGRPQLRGAKRRHQLGHCLPHHCDEALHRIAELVSDLCSRGRLVRRCPAEGPRPELQQGGALRAGLGDTSLELLQRVASSEDLSPISRGNVPLVPGLVLALVEGHPAGKLRLQAAGMPLCLPPLALQRALQSLHGGTRLRELLLQRCDGVGGLLRFAPELASLLPLPLQVGGLPLKIRGGSRLLLADARELFLVRPEVLEQLHVQLLVLLNLHLQVVPEHADLLLHLLHGLLLGLAGNEASDRPAALLRLLL
mmetsp:Transcript_33381/g.99428  ORF Transcript_33381/g.99428 Transcript_33381/m.99428 type:complete len:340 (+) Transcript_33381:164-1183(+)